MKLLTAKKGYAHFTSAQFRAFVQCVIGSGSYIADFGKEIVTEIVAGNIIKVSPFMLIHHGGLFLVEEAEDVVYQNGTQGMKRIDLIVARYTKTAEGIEEGEWVVIAGTPATSNPATPSYTEGNMQDGDLIDDCPVFKITLDGLNVESVELLVDRVKPLSQKQNQIQGTNTVPTGGESGDVYIQFDSE